MMRLMLLCVVTIGISGCVHDKVQAPPDASCSMYTIIKPSKNDTAETKAQILEFNRIYREVCGNQ